MIRSHPHPGRINLAQKLDKNLKYLRWKGVMSNYLGLFVDILTTRLAYFLQHVER